MMTNTFDSSILEGNRIINGIVQIKDGLIVDNPFSKSVGNCLAAKWILDNEELVKRKIAGVMREQRLGQHEIDECFGFAVYFFLEKEERDFNKDHFGDEASDTYTIDIYCLHKITSIVYEYRNEMRKRLDKNIYLVDIDKDEHEKMPKKCISYDVLSKVSFDDARESYGFDEIFEFEELQEILDIEIPFYNEEFRILGMNNFDLRSYVYHMFLSGKEITLDGDYEIVYVDEEGNEIKNYKEEKVVKDNDKAKKYSKEELKSIDLFSIPEDND